ncbi:MAG: protein kinase [Planctomycetes bacterium]|nr:protein kinase [Planctomycetota bacterium]
MPADPNRQDTELSPDHRVAQDLVRKGKLRPNQLLEALERQKVLRTQGRLVSLTEVLVEMGLASWSQVAGKETTRPGLKASAGLAPGESLGAYRIEGEIASGGMGVVYRATDTVLHRDVAIKVLKASEAKRSEFLARFLREGRAMSKLRHPNLLTCLASGQEGDLVYLVLPFVEGERLDDYMERNTPDLGTRVRMIRDLASCLSHIHERDMVHRDVKPANVLVEESGNVRLIDFGLVKARDLEGESLTASGEMLGTPRYMSPEQVKADMKKIGPPTDIFSLGAVAYEIWTGRVAFDARTRDELASVIERCNPEPPSTFVPGFPKELERILERALAKDPADRFEGAHEFTAALDRFLASGTGLESKTRDVPRRKPSLWSADIRGEGARSAAGRRPSSRRARTIAGGRRKAHGPLAMAGAAAGLFGVVAIAGAVWLSREKGGDRPGPDGEGPPRSTDRDGRGSEPDRANPPPVEVEDPARQFSLAVRSRPPGALVSIVTLDSATLVREDEPRELGRTPLGPLAFDLEREGGARILVLVRGVERSVSLPRAVLPEDGKLPAVEIDVDLDDLAPAEILVENGPEGSFALSRDETTVGDYELAASRWELARPTLPPGDRELPVRGLSWFDAWLYALVEGRRLPTSEEWELAAFGPWGAPYPHGHGLGPLGPIQSEYLATWVHTVETQVTFQNGIILAERLRPPGSRPEDIGPYGARDMAFNAQEWTSTLGDQERTFGEWTPILRGFDYFAPRESLDQPDAHLVISQPASVGAYAAGVRTCRSVLPRARARSLASLAELARSAGAVGVRTAALVRLAALSDPGVTDVLATFLAEPEPEVRARVLFLLAARGTDPRAIQAAETGLSDSDPRVRLLSLALLRVARRGGSAVARAVPLLSDPVPAVRRGAVGYLASVAPSAESMDAIAGKLGMYADFDVRAARALAARLPDARVASLLAGAGNRDPFATELVLAALLLPPTSPELADARAIAGSLQRGTRAARLAADLLDAAADRPGVVGRYYSGGDLASPLLTRIDAEPDHSWRSNPPAEGLPPDRVGVRWIGYLRVDEPGDYVFEAYVDDGLRFSIDRRPLLDYFGHGFRTIHRSKAVHLDAGLHPIVAETVDHWGDALFHLFWSKDGGERQRVPADRFFHSAGQARALGAG